MFFSAYWTLRLPEFSFIHSFINTPEGRPTAAPPTPTITTTVNAKLLKTAEHGIILTSDHLPDWLVRRSLFLITSITLIS